MAVFTQLGLVPPAELLALGCLSACPLLGSAERRMQTYAAHTLFDMNRTCRWLYVNQQKDIMHPALVPCRTMCLSACQDLICQPVFRGDLQRDF